MKSYFKIPAIAVVVFALLAPISCENSVDEEIPYNVVEATAEMFEFVGMVFEAQGDYTLHFSSVDFSIIETGGWGTYPYTVEITANGEITPPEGDVIIKDFYFKLYIDVHEDPPWTTITITWTGILENWLYNTVSLDASFGWGSSISPEGPPDTYSGTITVDGKSYSLAKVIDTAGWEELAPDNNGEEPN